MRTLTPFALAPLLLLAGCPDYEGPIDVILVDMDDTAVVEWAEAGGGDFEACSNGTTDPEASAGCGPHGVGEPGTYTIRVSWMDEVVDKDVTIEKDGDYQANTSVTFSAEEFGVEADDTGAE